MSITLTRPPVSPGESGSPRRWTREEVYRLYNMGFFNPDEKLELIAGEPIQKMTQNPPHAVALMESFAALARVFGQAYCIRVQMPLVLATDGEPEPDLLVARGRQSDYLENHPTQDDTLLVVEISDSTLALDRGRKAAYYAEAGITDYWIVNLVDRCLEVRRNPVSAPDTTFGFAYSSREIFREGESAAPLAIPQASIAVSDLLPQRA